MDQRLVARLVQEESANLKSPIYGLVNKTSTAAMGHSMGGGASYLSADEFSDLSKGKCFKMST